MLDSCYPSQAVGSGVHHLQLWIWGVGSGVRCSAAVQICCIMGLHVSICIYYTVYIAVFTHIQIHLYHAIHQLTSARPQIGPDFQGFGMFSWIPWCVTCCYTYCNTYLHTPYAVHICAYVCYVVYIMPSTVGCRPSPPPNPPWGTPPIARIPAHLHILYVCIYYMGYIGTYYTCATTC